MNTPCYKCEERHSRCHSECEKYKAFQAANDKVREARKEGRDAADFLGEGIRKAIKQNKRKK